MYNIIYLQKKYNFKQLVCKQATLLQGDVISPTLFLFFINDLALEIKQLNLVLELDKTSMSVYYVFADDIV